MVVKSRTEQKSKNLWARRPARIKMQNLKCRVTRIWTRCWWKRGIHFRNSCSYKHVFNDCSVLKDGSREILNKRYHSGPGWCSWEHHPVHQRVTGLITGQATGLGYRFSPRLGCLQKATE